jgi:hypothetical protein
MTPEERAAIDHDAQRWAATVAPPEPVVAARLRHLFNPPDLTQRLERLDADPDHRAQVDERATLRADRRYTAERERLANAGHHDQPMPEPKARNQRPSRYGSTKTTNVS